MLEKRNKEGDHVVVKKRRKKQEQEERNGRVKWRRDGGRMEKEWRRRNGGE